MMLKSGLLCCDTGNTLEKETSRLRTRSITPTPCSSFRNRGALCRGRQHQAMAGEVPCILGLRSGI